MARARDSAGVAATSGHHCKLLGELFGHIALTVRVRSETSHAAIRCDRTCVQEAGRHVHHWTQSHWYIALSVPVVPQAYQLGSFVDDAGVAAACRDSTHTAELGRVALAVTVGAPAQEFALSRERTCMAELGGDGRAARKENAASHKFLAHVHGKSWHLACFGAAPS